MEVATINVIKPPNRIVQRRARNSFPYALIAQDLENDIEHWRHLLRTIAERREILLRSQTYCWSEIDVVDMLPTDLLTYFVHELEPDIAPEIGKLLMDGRVHIVLILSHREFPVQQDWCQRFKNGALRGKRSSGGLVIPDTSEDVSFAPLIQLHEMRSFTGKILGDLLEKIEERKKKYDFDCN